MKKCIMIVLFLTMLFSLTACKSLFEEVLPTTESAETLPTTENPGDTQANTGETEAPAQTPAETEPTELNFWDEEDVQYPMSFYFSSGAGGWGTELLLQEDGSFTGSFHDSNMGEIGEGYPCGTVYTCNFSGRFSPAERLDMYTYGMKLEELTTDRPAGEEWIEDEIRYVSAAPYGLEGGEDFLIYLPNTPATMLSEDQSFWWPGRYYEDYTTLNGYGLYNTADDSGFFSMIEE